MNPYLIALTAVFLGTLLLFSIIMWHLELNDEKKIRKRLPAQEPSILEDIARLDELITRAEYMWRKALLHHRIEGSLLSQATAKATHQG